MVTPNIYQIFDFHFNEWYILVMVYQAHHDITAAIVLYSSI